MHKLEEFVQKTCTRNRYTHQISNKKKDLRNVKMIAESDDKLASDICFVSILFKKNLDYNIIDQCINL